MAKTFNYFAYGSNLLAQRLTIKNPSAVRKGIGRLDDFRLDFDRPSDRWGGCSATIVPDKGKYVWGSIWELDQADMASLDEQEGVQSNVYIGFDVCVTTPEKENVTCRVFQMAKLPYDTPPQGLIGLPETRRPSRIYLEIIIQGAIESKLPGEYIQMLKSIPHNKFIGPILVEGLNVEFKYTN